LGELGSERGKIRIERGWSTAGPGGPKASSGANLRSCYFNFIGSSVRARPARQGPWAAPLLVPHDALDPAEFGLELLGGIDHLIGVVDDPGSKKDHQLGAGRREGFASEQKTGDGETMK
jgi:hypothetical protein